MNIAKYFWELNEKALKEAKIIIGNPKHPRFFSRIITLLSRCGQPKELFSLISKSEFIKAWPGIRARWLKLNPESDFRDWWETVYEQLLRRYRLKQEGPKSKPPVLLSNIGRMVKEARIRKGLSQKELSLIIGMKQPDISIIEKGKKNVTP